uniref:TPR-like protein n=1 Tax=Dunaliella tertiolecta TaxID=3047 RepID=A0A7S3QZ63_DUNTE
MLLEMALGQYSYGFVEHGQKLLNEAGTVLGLQVQLSGALGRRTVYQENAKAQLVVRSSRVRAQQPPIQDPLVTSFGFEPILQPQAAAAASGVPVSPGGGGGTEAEKVHSKQPTHGMVDESDVFMAPKLVAEDGQVLEPRYSATEQALLLAWATHVKKGSAQDELQLWEMAPYLEAVLSQPRSHMMLQATARLLKARHERTRNRTRERALLHMEQLLEALAAHPASSTRPQPESDSRGADGGASKGSQGEGQQASSSGSRNLTNTHLPYAYDCWFPLRVHLRKELAEHYMSMGFVGAALGIYEELQLWDALVVCYRLLDKRGAAEDLLKRRLKVTPDDPVIWCNLGDLYTDDSYYEEAWKRSGCRHARSKRSLGRSALRRKDYAVAAAHFEEALAVNPLNPDAWFSQGYAYLKLGEQRKALRALTNVTQQVPEHAEAWNNVAALWLELGEPKRAYSALGECLRYKRDSWQIWENYAQVAQQAGFHLQATRALAQVMQLSAGTRLHLPVLHQLVQAVEDTQRGSSNADHNNQRATNSDEAPGGTADTEEGDGDNTDDLAGFVLDIPASLGQLPWAMGSSSGRNGEEEGEAHAALPYQTRSAYQAGVEAAQQRAEEQMRTAVGKVLKDAVNLPCCNPEVWGLLGRYYSLTGQLEGAKEALLKQVRALSGSAAFKSDEARFVEVADASLALAQAYLQLYRGSSSSSSAAPPQGTSSSIQNANLNGSNYSAPAQQESAALAPPASSPAVPCAAAAAAAAAATTPLVVQPGSIRELAAARMHLRGLLKQCEPVFGEHAKWQALSNACAEISAAEVDAKSSQQSR